MTVTVVYTCSTDGSPFRSELLTPWMKATLVDFYTNVFVLLVRIGVCSDGVDSPSRSSLLELLSFSKLLRDIGNGLAGAVLVVVQGNKFHFQDPVDTLFLRARQVGAATRQHYEVVVFDTLEGEIDKAVVI